MASIAVELVSRWDVDGIELDYMRHPAFFRIEEAYPNRYLMTDLHSGTSASRWTRLARRRAWLWT